MPIIAKQFSFSSSHRLVHHRGKCANDHGHNYHLEVRVAGPVKESPGESDEGMVLDYGDLKALVEEAILEPLDHQNLNLVTSLVTTAENLACWIGEQLLAAGLTHLHSIRLSETDSTWAEVSREEIDTSAQRRRQRRGALALLDHP